MRNYIKEYIKRTFNPHNLDDVVNYVVQKIDHDVDVSNHESDRLIDKLALDYLYGYYNEKYANSFDDGRKDELNEEINYQTVLEDKLDFSEVISVVNGTKVALENERIFNQIMEIIASCLEEKKKYMFNFSGSFGQMALGVYKSMEYDQEPMLDYIISELRSNNSIERVIQSRRFNMYLNNYIIKLCYSNPEIIQFKNSFLSVRSYIRGMMEEYYQKLSNKKRIREGASVELASVLLGDSVDLNAILQGKYDEVIQKWILKDELKRKSVGNKAHVVNKDNKKAKKIKNVKMAIAVVFILWVSNTSLGKEFFDGVENLLFSSSTEKVNIEVVDSYKYPEIENFSDSDYYETIHNIDDVFHKYRKYNVSPNDRYEQLCLYKAFDSISNHDLDVMEVVFSEVREDFQKYGEMDFAKKADYEAIFRYDSYVGYMYDMLRMALEDVDSYNQAVSEYLLLLRSNEESNLVISPYNSLPDDLRKDLEKMIKHYDKYCHRLEEQLVAKLNKDKGR